MASTAELEAEILADLEENPNAYTAPVNDVITIDPETKTINLPSSEVLFGTEEEHDVERKYFKCPRIVGDNIDLFTHQIYISYMAVKDKNATFIPDSIPQSYWCDDVALDETGNYITFSWLLSGNVLASRGFVGFAVIAKSVEGDILKTRWKTAPAVGTVLMTLPDAGEGIAELYPDIITQLLDRMDAVEEITSVELDGTLTDNTKAAPAGMVGELKVDLSKLSEEKIDNPSTGSVGQILEIESVDEKGKPKTYKAVDKPTSSGEVSDEQISSAVSEYMANNPIEESDPTVPEWAKSPQKPTYTASEVGADAAGTAVAKVSEHNTASNAHNDIRMLVQGLAERLNALADSDDTTLDQMSEIVSYIKYNRSLINSIDTNKVDISDIINNLTSNNTNKPLSAKQGRVLKSLIDAITVVELDESLTDNTKAAPAGMVGELKGDLVDLKHTTLYGEFISLGKNGDSSDNPTFYGYGVPIKKTTIRKVNLTIMADQSLAQENVTLKCQIKNNNDDLLGETECTVYAQHYHNSIYEFIFDDDIEINTDYGWLYVFSENYKLGYCTVTTTNINKDIVYDYQTNNVTGKYIGVLNGDWWNLNTDQSYQFNLCFELFSFDYNGSIPLRNEERITEISGKIVNDTVITVSNATELKNALDGIATSTSNNKANAKNRYTIQLNSGTYDMYSICRKSGYVDQEKFNRGIEIPDYVSLVGIGNVILECNIPDSDNTSDYLPSRIISVINTYGENSFENINFVATNCRYCVHDDNGGDYKYRTISFKNCTFKHNGVNNADVWPSPECYGAGYTAGRKGRFENCTFEGDFLPFYIHSSSEWWMTDKFEVSIKNCAFITTYENAIDLQDAYGTDLQGVAHIDNCYLTGKIRLSGSKPWTIYGGGNSNVEVSNENNSKIYLVN